MNILTKIKLGWVTMYILTAVASWSVIGSLVAMRHGRDELSVVGLVGIASVLGMYVLAIYIEKLKLELLR